MNRDKPPNTRVSLPHSAVTARAYCGTRRATGRARYAQRWTDETLIGFLFR